jgi:excisionase family DNA binding protein
MAKTTKHSKTKKIEKMSKVFSEIPKSELIDGIVNKAVPLIIEQLNNTPTSSLFDYKNAAKYVSLSVSTLQHMVGRNEISFIRIGGSIRFEKSDLDDFIASNKIPKK